MPKTYTTSEAAAKIPLSRETLYTWLEQGKIRKPKQIQLGNKTHYLWTDADIATAEKYKRGRTRKTTRGEPR